MLRAAVITIASQASKRIRHHDCWVFRDELIHPPKDLEAGAVVEVHDEGDRFIGWAFWSLTSHIALRMISLELKEPTPAELLPQRLTEAIARRAHLAQQTNACRLVFSEADALPGLIVDRYDRWLVVQFRAAGMDRWRSQVIDQLTTLLQPAGILERSDKEFREEEGLPPVTQALAGSVPERVKIEEAGLSFWVDPWRGQKTGFYLDQRVTRNRMRQLVGREQRVLDVFSYTGATGINAAVAGANVVCIERDEAALALGKENAQLNGVADRMEFIAADAFYWLEHAAAAGKRSDVISLDPPGLAKSRQEIQGARRALHHLLVHGFRALAPSGQLLLSLCTYHILGLAEEIVRIAAADDGVRLRVRDHWLQAEDHPWLLQIPATRYLASWCVVPDGPRSASPTS